MFDRILKRIRENVRTCQYVMTIHAEEEMDDEGFSIFDIERGILTGEIAERQEDRETGEWKYIVKGESTAGDEITVVARLSVTGRLVIITVYGE
ncbi:MAG: DUF4258 domain-containing protein [bacterium]|nr:DUF4258 domain-containing protein [bacterium]